MPTSRFKMVQIHSDAPWTFQKCGKPVDMVKKSPQLCVCVCVSPRISPWSTKKSHRSSLKIGIFFWMEKTHARPMFFPENENPGEKFSLVEVGEGSGGRRNPSPVGLRDFSTSIRMFASHTVSHISNNSGLRLGMGWGFPVGNSSCFPQVTWPSEATVGFVQTSHGQPEKTTAACSPNFGWFFFDESKMVSLQNFLT